MLEIRWHGRGGQGSFTVARLLGMAASVYGGKYAQAFPSFGPERRGAPVLGFTRIDDKKITDRSEVYECDYVIVLDETLWGPAVLSGLKENTVIIINTESKEKYIDEVANKVVCFNATSLAIEYLKRPITNTAMMAVLIGVSEIVSMDDYKNAIKESMKPKIADKNILLVDKVYHMVKEGING
jgi:pyruvate ferredoxin oxidoreductase gamma subunit